MGIPYKSLFFLAMFGRYREVLRSDCWGISVVCFAL
jgi:hypothetical protein